MPAFSVCRDLTRLSFKTTKAARLSMEIPVSEIAVELLSKLTYHSHNNQTRQPVTTNQKLYFHSYPSLKPPDAVNTSSTGSLGTGTFRLGRRSHTA
ncbi:hypothetical protein AVEN_52628-1 [Araneus ventricosus]|uniref:Uncharacterized protein n=1 Tax=Araneus ventricosus TaxID=182803 RepID=A0A4Y2EQP5_ARAVE|nr:hypothetical protein AVEN_52628-1 [Araneus ventricosus]